MKELKRKGLRGKDRAFSFDDGLQVKVWVNRIIEEGHLVFLVQAFNDKYKKPAEDELMQARSHTIHRGNLPELEIKELIDQESKAIAEVYARMYINFAAFEEVPDWKEEEGEE